MASVFSRIIAGDLPSYKVAEDEHHIAILDIQPLVNGHTLVIPKREVEYYFDLDDGELARLNAFAKRVAKAVFREVPCLRVGMAVIGLEVPHVHMHLVPLNQMKDIDFTKPKLELSPEQLTATAERIRRVVLP